MDVVIVAQYLGDIEHLWTFNSRFIYLAGLLEAENDVEIVTSDFLHGPKKFILGVDKSSTCKITALHECGYQRNVCFRRFKSHRELAKNIAKYMDTRKKPDIVYCAIPSVDVASVVSEYCKKNSIRFIIDVQDLWPEAFKMVFHIPVLSDFIFMPMKMKVDKVYANADKIIAVSKTYADRILQVNKKCKEAIVVFLGTDLAKFDAIKDGFVHPKAVDEIWLAYIGQLAASYDIESVLDALFLIKKHGTVENIKFIIMGDGPLRVKFWKKAKELKVDVVFTGMLSYPEMVARLCICDIAVNPIRAGSAGSIINKVGDYAAAGLPVVNTQECLEYRELLDQYNAGINCDNGDVKAITNAIEKFCLDENLRKNMGEGNRRLAEERFDRRVTYKLLI